jgi:hypothetical protein
VSNFEHHIAQLADQGFTVERGMLTGAFADASQIGVRFVSANTQVDTYLVTEFFDADKSHPVLGVASEVSGPEGGYLVFPILKG